MDAVELLLSRDSAVKLQEPGPSPDELDTIFKSALRAPDHGRLRPWRFIVIAEAKRERFGELMADLLKLNKPDATPEMLAGQRQKALRSPVIVVAVARTIKTEKNIPDVEQLLSAGAATQNIMLATHALGYGAMWSTGWPAYDTKLKQALGLEPSDAIAGFIYIGTRTGGSKTIPRPVPADYVSTWQG